MDKKQISMDERQMRMDERQLIIDKTVSCYDKHAEAYDQYQYAVVPGYQEMLNLVAEAAGRYLPKGPKILDLGCGTGNASLAILKTIPANIFLIDGSERMVNAALKKIMQESPGSILGYQVRDISQEDWFRGLEGEEYDSIVSTLVLEHLPFDRYREVIKRCYHILKPGGWFLVSEGYAEYGSDMHEWFFHEMDTRRQALDPEVSEFVARLRDENEVHYYCSKEKKREWWTEVGFEQVNVIWQYLCIALMIGRKPNPR